MLDIEKVRLRDCFRFLQIESHNYIKAIEGVVPQLIVEYSYWLSVGSLLKPNLGGQNDFKGGQNSPFPPKKSLP